MAEVEKFTDNMMMLEKHYDRLLKKDRNKDIDPKRTKQNYSISLDHGGLKPNEYYKKLLDEKYVYGRGTRREKKAVTACAWVITAPADIVGDKRKEKAFFQGAFDFVSNRYGSENMIHDMVHYDEAGRPHIHILFCPVTRMDKDRLHYSTRKVAKPVRLESGRYEYEYSFKLDKNGERIPLKNYSRKADYYDEKISAADVLNKFELQNFHKDFQSYLDEHGIEGQVLNGATDGGNLSVKALKEFTSATGLTLEALKENPLSSDVLGQLLEKAKLSRIDCKRIELINQVAINEKLEDKIKDLEGKLRSMKVTKAKQAGRDWGDTSEWGKTTGWGNKDNTKEVEKVW